MKFERAFKFMMQSGEKIKLPSWGGYWYWDNEKKTVIMHTKDGKEIKGSQYKFKMEFPPRKGKKE